MTRTLDKKSKKPSSAPASDDNGRKPARSSHRDFFEQVAIAFIAAFLVRVFSAEAFVIPTGSMAPTLMGMHKELDCPIAGSRSRPTSPRCPSTVPTCSVDSSPGSPSVPTAGSPVPVSR